MATNSCKILDCSTSFIIPNFSNNYFKEGLLWNYSDKNHYYMDNINNEKIIFFKNNESGYNDNNKISVKIDNNITFESKNETYFTIKNDKNISFNDISINKIDISSIDINILDLSENIFFIGLEQNENMNFKNLDQYNLICQNKITIEEKLISNDTISVNDLSATTIINDSILPIGTILPWCGDIGLNYIELIRENDISFNDIFDNIILNENNIYGTDLKYSIRKGKYIIKNIPKETPIGFSVKTNFSYKPIINEENYIYIYIKTSANDLEFLYENNDSSFTETIDLNSFKFMKNQIYRFINSGIEKIFNFNICKNSNWNNNNIIPWNNNDSGIGSYIDVSFNDDNFYYKKQTRNYSKFKNNVFFEPDNDIYVYILNDGIKNIYYLSNNNSLTGISDNDIYFYPGNDIYVHNKNSKYILSNESSDTNLSYNENTKYYFKKNTSYNLKNIPGGHPLGFINSNKGPINSFNISGTPHDTSNKTDNNNIQFTSDVNFYTGDITLTINNDFNLNTVSLVCLKHGYMGGENKIAINNGNFVINNNNYYFKNGTYNIKNIPNGYPMSIISENNTIIEDNSLNIIGTNNISSTSANNIEFLSNINFYTGDISLNINNNFGIASLICLNHGYMGGKNIINYYNDISGTFQTLTEELNNIKTYYGDIIIDCSDSFTGEIDIYYKKNGLTRTTNSKIIYKEAQEILINNKFLLCNGFECNYNKYPKLFDVIGNQYGGANSNNFKIPNINGKIIIGNNNSNITDRIYTSNSDFFDISGSLYFPQHKHTNISHTHIVDANYNLDLNEISYSYHTHNTSHEHNIEIQGNSAITGEPGNYKLEYNDFINDGLDDTSHSYTIYHTNGNLTGLSGDTISGNIINTYESYAEAESKNIDYTAARTISKTFDQVSSYYDNIPIIEDEYELSETKYTSGVYLNLNSYNILEHEHKTDILINNNENNEISNFNMDTGYILNQPLILPPVFVSNFIIKVKD